ncbi:prepilin-type N-terminal cleavage/methylation domain-containing protein [Aliiroseovarius halocynthiae]|uniref:Prepilin-type N-terminal cleavage/methylation domain-containing protein n=1 Tax=Aliiroseovarius halocynthiae TaxID=985055 RepID=A0A545SLE4_9RHOB|nr:prepilin-type N-terminal cleavage/methylation domain-containing protein [Aliiroseovarius halocynthiae]TQV65803.1 prepilin-type N-terminal cleavage/methylation domain-containing protein [Aliiroseovarius halocynthiae]SMR83570.1 prepilin-type N-terminal cleavage/methylation domain-containing protein [Aliiroseovarius halocynthiae]
MKRSKAGLSLLEMLVSLALLTVIAVGLATSLNLGARAFSRVEAVAKQQPELALRIRLREWLSSATPPDRLTNVPITFQGTPTTLSFVSFAPTPFAPDLAALRVTVRLGETIQLIAEAPNGDGSQNEPTGGTLAQNVTNARLAYFDALSAPPQWVENWAHTNRLPALVRITADPDSQPAWPEMTVRLQHVTLPAS